MDKDNQENSNQYSSADFMMKRKRGRPRKHLRIDSNEQDLSSPPGYEKGNKNQTDQRDDVMVGQPICGVIEAAFEAGYLLSVKVGNSESVMRGVVFKPGQCIPVSTENDVAPNVPMIPRNSIPRGGRKSRSHEEHVVKRRALVPVPIQSKNHLVPVVLQPANLQNGERDENPIHDPSRAPPQAAIPINQASPADIHTLDSQTETVSQAISPTPINHGKPFETLLTEVMNRVQIQGKTSSVEADSDDQALSIEPLQAIHPVHPVHMHKPLPGYRRGKMTELLQAVQENVRDGHVQAGE